MDVNEDTDVAEWIKEKHLLEAENSGRFSPQPTEFHFIQVSASGKCIYNMSTDNDDGLSDYKLPAIFAHSAKENSALYDSVVDESYQISCFRCIFQRSRPRHVSGRPDSLPFKDAEAAREVFWSLGLPSAYLEIADGSQATVHSHVTYAKDGQLSDFELIAHCITKQGDWAIALSHNISTSSTSTFWSVDERTESVTLTEQLHAFRRYALHPMLVPCIMLSATLQVAMQRRFSIKERLDRIEKAVARISEDVTMPFQNDQRRDKQSEETHDLEHLFGLLHTCRKDQVSRKGRYDFWYSFNGAIEEGFKYATTALALKTNEQHAKAHNDLVKWKSLTWRRLQSLMARDEDHNSRVDNVSYLLYTLNQQRDIRLQSSIAHASQRDSEDMKYIAVLGSVFLPASLVATILNVPGFQFLEGAKLFGAYIAITMPFVAIVVVLCFARRYRNAWVLQRLRSLRASGRSMENLQNRVDHREVPTRQNTSLGNMSRKTTGAV